MAWSLPSNVLTVLLGISCTAFSLESTVLGDTDDATVFVQVSVAKAGDEQFPLLRAGYSSGHQDYWEAPGRRHRISTPNLGGMCGFSLSGVQVPSRQTQMLNCTDSLPVGIPDMRGDWEGALKSPTGVPLGIIHSEHIEQCLDRVVIVTDSNVMDFLHADGTFERGLQDYDETKLPYCVSKVAAGEFDGAGCFVMTNQRTKSEKSKWCLDQGMLKKVMPDGAVLLMKRVAGPTDLVPVYEEPVQEQMVVPEAPKRNLNWFQKKWKSVRED